MTQGAAASLRWPPGLALLKISKVPFWFIWMTPFIFGYIASGTAGHFAQAGWFVLAVAGVCLIESANCVHNELVDQEEDAINQPNRPSLVASVGERSLWRYAVAAYAVSFLGAIVIGIAVRPLVAVMMVAAWIAAPIYNWGLRLKRHPGWAEIDIAWATFFGYLAGWVWNQPLLRVPAVLWVVTYFFGVTALMKDLPDVAGDEQVHAPGIFSLKRVSVRRAALVLIAGTPYALIVALAAAGALPLRMLGMLVLACAGAFIMLIGERARTMNEFILAYELSFLYVHVFMLVLFVLYTPTLLAATVAALLFIGRGLALAFQLAPRFVEPSFTWRGSWYSLARRS